MIVQNPALGRALCLHGRDIIEPHLADVPGSRQERRELRQLAVSLDGEFRMEAERGADIPSAATLSQSRGKTEGVFVTAIV